MLKKLFESRSKRLARLEREAVDAWEASGRDGPAPSLRLRTLALETATKFGLTTIILTDVRDEGSVHGLPQRFQRVVLCNPSDAAIERIGRDTMALPNVEVLAGEVIGLIRQTLFALDEPALVMASGTREQATAMAREVVQNDALRHAAVIDRTRLWVDYMGEADLAPLEQATGPRHVVTDRDGLVTVTPRLRT